MLAAPLRDIIKRAYRLSIIHNGGDKMKNKFLKILLPLFLIAILAFTVVGCGSSGGNSGGGSAASLDGTYKAGVDMTESLSKSSGLDIQTELVMYFILTLSSGKDYVMELDTDQFVKDTKAYYESEMPSLLKQALLNDGYSEDQIETVVKDQGFATFDEFADAHLAEVLKSVEEQFADSNSVLSKGTYKADGQKIALTDDSGTEVAPDGKIGDDGSLTFELPVNGEKRTIVFKK